jgi:subtilase family serine protease
MYANQMDGVQEWYLESSVWDVVLTSPHVWDTWRPEVILPDLAVRLIRTRDAGERPAEEGAGIVAEVAELTATIANLGDAVADETTTRFWVRGADMDRELRVVHTPGLLPGDEVEVTALWDVRDRRGMYTIIVTADAFAQIDEVRKDNNVATAHVVVRGTRVELI